MYLYVIFLCHWTIFVCYNASTAASFIVSFQSSETISVEEWAEYIGNMPQLNDITVCHWNKVNYFSDDVSTLWSYCTQKTSNDKMRCIQMEYKAILSRAYRHVKLDMWIFNDIIPVEIFPFRHRTWNHCCWSYSSKNHQHSIHVNGRIVAKKTILPTSNKTVWEGSNNVEGHAFIIGQEPDEIKGKYSLDQLFKGSIAELNIWDTILSEDMIMKLSTCQSFLKGSVKAWHLDDLRINKALVIKEKDISLVCKPSKMLVMFPKRQPFDIAKSLCSVHGGKIHTPSSAEENEEAVYILEKHRADCTDTITTDNRNLGKSIWLGIRRRNSIWEDVTYNIQIGATLNYSNWAIPNYGDNIEWSYIQSNGRWKYSSEKDSIELCTLCLLPRVPIFTLKGICKQSGIYFNYYLKINEKNEIGYYEAYKTSLPTENIRLVNKTWQSVGNRFSISLDSVATKTQYPIGRVMWNISDSNCGLNERKFLSFSHCEFGQEFTCRSGNCISIEKRCNNVKECEDNSDEIDCLTIDVPSTYRKVEPPRTHDMSPEQYFPIETQIILRSIDEINSLGMSMELTLDINMEWTDGRLTYTNLLENTRNRVDSSIVKRLWIPLDYIVHDNAMTGMIRTEELSRVLSVKRLARPLPPSLFDHHENRQFCGYANKLEVTQRFRIKYKCNFEMLKFPFDRQHCKFEMYLKLKSNMTLSFQNKGRHGVIYDGPQFVDQFRVSQISSFTGKDNETTWFTYHVQIDRNYMSQVIATFFPSCLLWLLSYFSLFINPYNFNNRFMGSVTVLLVIVSLRGSIASDLPKTSYFKYIDLWFLWYITNIFFIIAYHILVDNVSSETRLTIVTSQIMSQGNRPKDYDEEDTLIKYSTKARVNRYAIILFPLITVFFNIIYFTLTI